LNAAGEAKRRPAPSNRASPFLRYCAFGSGRWRTIRPRNTTRRLRWRLCGWPMRPMPPVRSIL